jgi:hypothetical protein
MESWKSGSQMTRTIDLRHWAQMGDIVPRCRDSTFSALKGSVPMTVPLESGSAVRGTRLAPASFDHNQPFRGGRRVKKAPPTRAGLSS